MATNYNLNKIFTPVRSENFAKFLDGYPREDKKFIVDGFSHGFKLHYMGDKSKIREFPNMKSALLNPREIWEKIMKEVVHKRVAGPYLHPPFESYLCSPLGLIKKAGEPNKFRMIFNLSAGGEISLNGAMPKEFKITQYNDFDKVIQLLQKLGLEARLGKADLEAAFRQVPIHPDFWPVLVFKAVSPEDKEKYYFVDKCLPFGSGESCQIYQRVSNALSWAVQQQTQKENVNYLDDFLFADLGVLRSDAQI